MLLKQLSPTMLTEVDENGVIIMCSVESGRQRNLCLALGKSLSEILHQLWQQPSPLILVAELGFGATIYREGGGV